MIIKGSLLIVVDVGQFSKVMSRLHPASQKYF